MKAKTVFVSTYERFRYGRWETVGQHFRSLPNC